jgi:hypothetical protein
MRKRITEDMRRVFQARIAEERVRVWAQRRLAQGSRQKPMEGAETERQAVSRALGALVIFKPRGRQFLYTKDISSEQEFRDVYNIAVPRSVAPIARCVSS